MKNGERRATAEQLKAGVEDPDQLRARLEGEGKTRNEESREGDKKVREDEPGVAVTLPKKTRMPEKEMEE